MAALCGALAAALAAMALQYTVGKKAFAEHDSEIREALAQFQRASEMLQELMAEDVAAYAALSALLKLPEAERMKHPEYSGTVVAAVRTPQAVGGFAMNVLERCAGLVDKTNKMLLSDLGIAAVYAHATVHASEMNVAVNLPLLGGVGDRAGADAVRREMAELSAKADRRFAIVRTEILGRL